MPSNPLLHVNETCWYSPSSPKQKLAHIIQRLEADGHRIFNMAEESKSFGIVGGIATKVKIGTQEHSDSVKRHVSVG